MSTAMNAEVRRVTPELAQQWLERRAINRRISPATVSRYAELIKSGRWILNGEAFKFNSQGFMTDGQHRCAAVIKANEPIQSLVVVGLADDAFETIDSGKGRSVPDALSIHGYKTPIVLAGILRLIYSYAKAGSPVAKSFNKIPTVSQVQFLRESPERERRLIAATKIGPPNAVRASFFSPRIAGYIAYIGGLVDPEIVTEYFAALKEPRRDDHPVSALRRRITHSLTDASTMSLEESLALATKTWNALYENQPAVQIKYRMFGQKAESFPTFKGLDVDRL